MLRLITLTLIVLLFVGCASPADRLLALDEAELREVSDAEILQALIGHRAGIPNREFTPWDRHTLPERLLQEGVRRGFWLEEDLPLIRREAIRIGMSEKALLASRGHRSFRQNHTTTEHGRRTQWVFNPHFPRLTYYVYTEGGKIVAIQN